MENFYWGWGVRDAIRDAIKRPLGNLGRSVEARRTIALAEEVYPKLQQYDLDTQAGIRRLGEKMASRILSGFVEDDQAINIEALAFHNHLAKFAEKLFTYENLFEMPSQLFGEKAQATDIIYSFFSGPSLSRSELWEIEDQLRRIKNILDDFDTAMGNIAILIYASIEPLFETSPSLLKVPQSAKKEKEFDPSSKADIEMSAPLSMSINKPGDYVERLITLPFSPEFDDVKTTAKLRDRLNFNLNIVSGGAPGTEKTNPAKPKMPNRMAMVYSTDDLVKHYLEGTPLQYLLDYSVPISIPDETRFEHHHIVAGSGHGKTQTIQQLILRDLDAVKNGNASIVVIDSQGELIKNISQLKLFEPDSPLFERFVVIDPTDIEYPVALNLFDVKMDRINEYSQLDREKLINGILELYDFVLGSLLSAEMTQKQSVIFRYITRLMIQIPNATIVTLRELLEEGGSDKYREHINKLEGSARAFFDTEFDSKEFVQTKKQVLRRLWGILENQSFERMFLHPRNKLDLFSELNAGKVILINTAKDLLKENGTEIFGRFFIAMIAQAAQERSVIDRNKRMPTYVYVDEAADYFDSNIGIILSQARKYKVGMILAHQFLGQLDNKLQEAIFTNTSIRFAGGVSSKDARSLASEMRTDASFIENQDKLSLAAFVRGTTQKAVSIKITPGQMEQLPKLTGSELQTQRDYMREHYCVHYTKAQQAAMREPNSEESASDVSNEELNSPDTESPSANQPNDKTYSEEPESW